MRFSRNSFKRRPRYLEKFSSIHLFYTPLVFVWTRMIKGSFSCKRGFSLLNFERGLKKNYGLPNLETLSSYYSLLETATVLILCKNMESFLRYDCSKWDMLFSQRWMACIVEPQELILEQTMLYVFCLFLSPLWSDVFVFWKKCFLQKLQQNLQNFDFFSSNLF